MLTSRAAPAISSSDCACTSAPANPAAAVAGRSGASSSRGAAAISAPIASPVPGTSPRRPARAFSPHFSPRGGKSGASQAAEKRSTGVILSAAKDLALRIFSKMHRARFFASLRMTVSKSFSAACSAPPFRQSTKSDQTCWEIRVSALPRSPEAGGLIASLSPARTLSPQCDEDYSDLRWDCLS